MHARYDSKEVTTKARAAFMRKFETAVDPQGILPLEERQKRAEAARKAPMARLRLKAAQSRARKQKQRGRP